MRLDGRHTIESIVETLRRISATNIDQNLWLFDFADKVTDDMNSAFSTDFGRKVMTLNEIRKNIGESKKI